MSNGNESWVYWSQSARRAEGCRGATSALLSQVSRRRTRSHQPHHGTLIVNTPTEGAPSPDALFRFSFSDSDDVVVTTPTYRTNQGFLYHVDVFKENLTSEKFPLNLRCPRVLECTIRWHLEKLPLVTCFSSFLTSDSDTATSSAVIRPSLSELITLINACFSVNN